MILERLNSFTSEIHPLRPYRNFFIWSANLPLQGETIEKSFSMTESVRIVDLVGCANITNLISIAESFSHFFEGEVRLFDAARETNMLLPHYFKQIGINEVSKSDETLWDIPENTTLPIIGHDPYITHAPVRISLVPNWYEDVFYQKKRNADIVFVDKTLMWSMNPIGLLNTLAWCRGTKDERKIVISIYDQLPIIIHALRHGSRIGGIRKLDKASYPKDAYPGLLATLSDILRDGSEPLWRINRPGRFYAYPKRTDKRTHWLPDFNPSQVDMSQTIYARQYGTFKIDDEIAQLIVEGNREFWDDGSEMLRAKPSSNHDRKFIVGAFDIVDAILRPDDIDPQKAKKILSRKHYTAKI